MALQFYFGPSGSGKSTTLYQDVVKMASQHTDRDYLIVVPEQFTMQTQKDLVLRHTDGGIMNIDVLSFGRLFYRVAEEMGIGSRPVLNDIGKALILRRIVSDPDLRLKTLGRSMKRIGYVNEVKSAISEFMQYSVSEETLLSVMASQDISTSLKNKLADLCELYGRFRSYIKDNYITTEESMDLLSEFIPDSEHIKRSVVILDGFTGFTPVQMKVIRALMNHAVDVIVSVEADGRIAPLCPLSEEDLFSLSSVMVQKLLKLAKEDDIARLTDINLGENRPVYRYREQSDLAFLESELFRYRNITFAEEPKHITVSEMPSIRAEVRRICINIRKLVREEGYRYRDIAVVSADLETYASYFEEYCKRYDIPYFLDRTHPILLNPLVEYIRSALDVYLTNYSYESMMHFIRCGLSGIEPEEADILDDYVRRFAIKGSVKWQRAFTYLTAEGEEAHEELQRVNEIRTRVMERLGLLKVAASKNLRSTSVRTRELYAFIEASGAAEYLDSLATLFEKEGQTVRTNEYRQIYKNVMVLLEQLEDLLGEEQLELKEFKDLLDAGFAEIKVGVIPQSADRVMIGDMQRTRLDKIRHMFFCGVNDGNIPKSGKGGILSDFDREFLKQLDIDMAPTPREEMFIQRLYLYMMMTKPLSGLHLSYCLVSAGGDEASPSYLIGTMKALFPLLKVQNTERNVDIVDDIECTEDALYYFADMQKLYASGEGDEEMLRKDLTDFMCASSLVPSLAEKLPYLSECLRATIDNENLPSEIAELLYGSVLHSSITRLEMYAGCAFHHFLTGGLKLNEDVVMEMNLQSVGSAMHAILHYFGEALILHHSSWTEFDDDLAVVCLNEAIEKASAEGDGFPAFSQSATNLYQFERIKATLLNCVKTIRYQICKGSFLPDRFEYSFEHVVRYGDKTSTSGGEQKELKLHGTIDRLDVCHRDDKTYIRIIDYKSSEKKLSLAAVYTGEQLQLVVYLGAAMEQYRKEFAGTPENGENDSAAHTDRRVIPAGMLYFTLSNDLITPKTMPQTDEEVMRLTREALRMTGRVNGEPDILEMFDKTYTEKSDVIAIDGLKKDGTVKGSAAIGEGDIDTLTQYVDYKIGCMAEEIMNGALAQNPYADSCKYCPYKGTICNFDAGLTGNGFRARPVKDGGAIEQMAEDLLGGNE